MNRTIGVPVILITCGLLTSPPPLLAASGLPRPDHVVIVVEENHGSHRIVGSASAPYINETLIPHGASFTDYHAVHHPSQPNYLELFAGSAHGVINDKLPKHQFAGPSLGGLLAKNHLGFVGYAEDMPLGCKGLLCGNDGRFVTRHCPWLYFTDVADGAAKAMTDFPSDFSTLPTVAFVIPNLDNDMHGVHGVHRDYIQLGDDWLKRMLDPYVQWAAGHNSLLILTWDEDDEHYVMPPPPSGGIKTSGSANKVPLILVGQMVKAGANDHRHDHLDLLRTLEDMYGLAHLGGSEHANAIDDVWVSH